MMYGCKQDIPSIYVIYACKQGKHKSRRWMACPVMDWDVLLTNINHVDGWDVLFKNINHVDGWDVLFKSIHHADGWDVNRTLHPST
jgi:hypothetical protein